MRNDILCIHKHELTSAKYLNAMDISTPVQIHAANLLLATWIEEQYDIYRVKLIYCLRLNYLYNNNNIRRLLMIKIAHLI